ncbi:MAG TPA: MIP/aquaporin family protein [Jiangellaceae bacterium]|jgi:glycerol uptake facilitator-like aquaporin|nr:MIP/aquaporin family protein [Jiangellaceae bacterium]
MSASIHVPLARRLAAEALGTGLLVTVVIGSGIAAARLSPGDVGLQLLENALTTAAGLAVIILLVGPVSGAHINPVISLADWWIGRRSGSGLRLAHLGPYAAAQIAGGILGAILANLMYDLPAITVSTTTRDGWNLLLSEIIATAGLVALVFALARSGRTVLVGPTVGAYIGAAYWFTASTSFANPAVTIGRMFSDTFAGIAPNSVPPFIAAQLVGATVGVLVVLFLYPMAALEVDVLAGPSDSSSRTAASARRREHTDRGTARSDMRSSGPESRYEL